MSEHDDATPPGLRSAARAALKELEEFRSRASRSLTVALPGEGEDGEAALDRLWRQHVIRLELWVRRTTDLLRLYDPDLSGYFRTRASKALEMHDQRAAFRNVHAECRTILTDTVEAPGSERKGGARPID